MGCIGSTNRTHSPSHSSRHRSEDVGADQQEAAAASRAAVIDNLRSAQNFASLLRKASRLAASINTVRLNNPSQWGPLHDEALSLHADLEQRIATDEGDSLETFQERLNTLQERFRSGG